MEIIRLEMDYAEPLPLTLISDRELSDSERKLLDEILATWPETRARAEGRSEFYRPRLWRDVGLADARQEIVIKCEWFPSEWFEPLSQRLAAELPSLRRLEIGRDFVSPPRDDRYIEIPRKVVRLDDDSAVEVAAFSIAKHPVSIAEFTEFVSATGHVTFPEQASDAFSFRDHPGLAMIPEHKRMSLPARFLSFLDAKAFCGWKGVRLPSEAEWLAAWLMDDHVYDGDLALKRFLELSTVPNALAEGGEELTGTVISADGRKRVVIRRGPRYFRKPKDALLDAYHRFVAPWRYFEFIQFRVCTTN